MDCYKLSAGMYSLTAPMFATERAEYSSRLFAPMLNHAKFFINLFRRKYAPRFEVSKPRIYLFELPFFVFEAICYRLFDDRLRRVPRSFGYFFEPLE